MLGRVQDWFDRHGSGRTVILGWVLTRALMMLVFATLQWFVIVHDVYYYDLEISGLFHHVPLSQTLNEYPTPVVWFLAVPYVLVAGSQTGYGIAFIAAMMALDATFT